MSECGGCESRATGAVHIVQVHSLLLHTGGCEGAAAGSVASVQWGNRRAGATRPIRIVCFVGASRLVSRRTCSAHVVLAHDVRRGRLPPSYCMLDLGWHVRISPPRAALRCSGGRWGELAPPSLCFAATAPPCPCPCHMAAHLCSLLQPRSSTNTSVRAAGMTQAHSGARERGEERAAAQGLRHADKERARRPWPCVVPFGFLSPLARLGCSSRGDCQRGLHCHRTSATAHAKAKQEAASDDLHDHHTSHDQTPHTRRQRKPWYGRTGPGRPLRIWATAAAPAQSRSHRHGAMPRERADSGTAAHRISQLILCLCSLSRCAATCAVSIGARHTDIQVSG